MLLFLCEIKWRLYHVHKSHSTEYTFCVEASSLTSYLNSCKQMASVFQTIIAKFPNLLNNKHHFLIDLQFTRKQSCYSLAKPRILFKN